MSAMIGCISLVSIGKCVLTGNNNKVCRDKECIDSMYYQCQKSRRCHACIHPPLWWSVLALALVLVLALVLALVLRPPKLIHAAAVVWKKTKKTTRRGRGGGLGRGEGAHGNDADARKHHSVKVNDSVDRYRSCGE